jgi:hypothetical protein
MQQPQPFLQVHRRHEAGADMLGGAGNAGIERIDVEGAATGHIAGGDRTLEEVNIVQPVHQPGDVIQVGQRRVPVFAGLGVDHMDGRAGRAEMNVLARQRHVVRRFLRMQGEVPRRLRDHVFDQRAGEQQPPFGIQLAARRRYGLGAGRDRIGDAHRFQQFQNRRVDALYVGIA